MGMKQKLINSNRLLKFFLGALICLLVVGYTENMFHLRSRYDTVHDFHEGLAVVELNDKYGYINTEGKEVVPPKYDYVGGFDEGFARVELDGKEGFVNKEGEEVVPLKYDGAIGLVPVLRAGLGMVEGIWE